MRATTLWGILLLTLGGGAQGQEAPTLSSLQVDEEVYSNVVVTSVTATDIYFTHSRGLGNAKLRKLSAELQQRFHYDAAAAASHQSQQAQDNAEYSHQLQAQAAVSKPAKASQNNSVSSPSKEPAPLQAGALLGKKFPPLLAEEWTPAQPDIQGKYVLVEFWATWCGYCVKSIPRLNGLQAHYQDKLAVVGLSDEPLQTIAARKDLQFNYTLATDRAGRLRSQLGITQIPYLVLLSPQNIVCYEGSPSGLDDEKLQAILAPSAP